MPDPVNLMNAPDLRDPVVLASQCADMAGGMEQQARAAQTGTAMAGHPYPAFFFGQVAAVLRAAASALQPTAKPAPTEHARVEADPVNGTVEITPPAPVKPGRR